VVGLNKILNFEIFAVITLMTAFVFFTGSEVDYSYQLHIQFILVFRENHKNSEFPPVI